MNNSKSKLSSHVLMIRPVRFAGNEQTAESNRFQQLASAHNINAQTTALHEFDALVAALRNVGVRVTVLDDTLSPHTPDSIFPNNWFSTHADGTVVLYPMQAENRRLERRMDVFDVLRAQGLSINHIVDLAHHESSGQFLEGTGSLVLDRVQRVAYACRSPRTHAAVLTEWASKLGYQLVLFAAADADGVPIYHTNVLMCVGRQFAVVCVEAIVLAERQRVLTSLANSGHEVIAITHAQMNQFAGNMLALQGAQEVVAMSASAHASLMPMQRERLAALGGTLVVVAIPTIERLGGGSVRCMLAEICLPLG